MASLLHDTSDNLQYRVCPKCGTPLNVKVGKSLFSEEMAIKWKCSKCGKSFSLRLREKDPLYVQKTRACKTCQHVMEGRYIADKKQYVWHCPKCYEQEVLTTF